MKSLSKRALILSVILLLTIIPQIPGVEAQTYTPITGEEWGEFINTALEYTEVVRSARFGNTVSALQRLTTTAGTPLSVEAFPAGVYYVVASATIYGIELPGTTNCVTAANCGLKFSVTPIRQLNLCSITPMPSQLSCSQAANAYQNKAMTDCLNVYGSGCAGNGEVVFPYVVEFDQTWTWAIRSDVTTTGVCGELRGFALPIYPTYDGIGNNHATCISNSQLAIAWGVWRKVELNKYSQTLAEDQIPGESFTSEWDITCTSTAVLTANSESMSIKPQTSAGFAYLTIAIKNPHLNGAQNVELVGNGAAFTTGLFTDDDILTSGEFNLTTSRYVWKIYRLGYINKDVNDTSTTTFDYTVRITGNQVAKQLCAFTPKFDNLLNNFDRRFYPPNFESVTTCQHTGFSCGLIYTWSKPDFITDVQFTITNSSNGLVSDATVSITNPEEFCITDSNGECEIENILRQNIKVTLRADGYIVSTFSITLPTSCNGLDTCPVTLTVSTVSDELEITDETADIVITFVEAKDNFQATTEKINQNITKSAQQVVYVFLMNLQTNPPTPVLSLRWEARELDFFLSYPLSGLLTNAQVGNYVIYVTNSTGGYLNSKPICVYASTETTCTPPLLDGGLLSVINEMANSKIVALSEKGSNNRPTVESVEDRALGYVNWFVDLIPWFFFGTIGVFVMFAVTTRKKVEP
jgi:hypothetical protein